MTIAKRHRDKFKFIKENISQSYEYFMPNYDRYNEFKKFVYKTTLTEDDIAVLTSLGKPIIEFNIMEAYISRLRGEFSRMEPGFVVRAQDGVKLVDPRIIDVLEGHFKAILGEADNDSFSYDIYTDLLTGGFSVAQVYTDYVSEMSFDQKIFVERVFDPTLCGFDMLARKAHKGDGAFCFQLFPMERDSVVDKYGADAAKGLKFSSNIEGFSWSYRAQKKDIVLVCDYFEKQFKEKSIVKLSNGRVVTVDDYEKIQQIWDEAGYIEQMPVPVGKKRKTTIEDIKRYRLSGSTVLDVTPTNYKYLPLVFFDGNSAMIRENNTATAEQLTRPYVYNVKDAQRLKNFAGQSLANELENTVEHKFLAAIEAVPDDYLDAYINVQKPSTLLYNAFLDGNPNQPLPPPREVARIPMPPEIAGTFNMTDNLMQSILGSYDAQLGIQNNELSGVAIMQGAMHSNAAAMPYTVGFIKGLNRVAQIVLDLIPKYYLTPRSIPIVRPDGSRDYEMINQKGGVGMNYDALNMEVKVKAGVNFEVQKQISLETIIQLMQSSEQFKAFMNAKGLKTILDNIDVRGIDGLRLEAEQWMKEQAEQQAQMMKQQQDMAQNQMSPTQLAQMQSQIEMAKIQQKKEAAEIQANVQLTKTATDDAVKTKMADIEFMKAMAEIQNSGIETAIQQEKVDAENTRSAVDAALSIAKHQHEVTKKETE